MMFVQLIIQLSNTGNVLTVHLEVEHGQAMEINAKLLNSQFSVIKSRENDTNYYTQNSNPIC